MTPTPDGDHGIEFEFSDGVEMIDSRAAGRPSIQFSREEFDAFVAGAQHGDFDFDFDEPGNRADDEPEDRPADQAKEAQ